MERFGLISIVMKVGVCVSKITRLTIVDKYQFSTKKSAKKFPVWGNCWEQNFKMEAVWPDKNRQMSIKVVQKWF